jgi:hypothetical protein
MWHVGDHMQVVVMDFKNWCGMLNIMGAIDVIHVSIAKPYGLFLWRLLLSQGWKLQHCC